MGAEPIHKTQGSRLPPLIGPGGKGRVPRVEHRPKPRGVGRSTLGWGEGAFLGFPGRTSFSLGCLPPLSLGVGMVRPTLLAFPAPSPLPGGGAAAILARQVAGKSQTLALGVQRGSLFHGRQRDPPSPSPLFARARGSEARVGRLGPCHARGGGAGGVAAASPGRTVPPQQGGQGLETAKALRPRAGCGGDRRLPRGGVEWAERGAEGTTGAGWGGNGTGATMAR